MENYDIESAEESKEEDRDELTERQREENEFTINRLRELARARTEDLDGLTDKLISDTKYKESIMKPLKLVRENRAFAA